MRLGCSTVEFTNLSRLGRSVRMMARSRELSAETRSGRHRRRHLVLSARRRAASRGRATLDVGAYAAHMAALLGAHIR